MVDERPEPSTQLLPARQQDEFFFPGLPETCCPPVLLRAGSCSRQTLRSPWVGTQHAQGVAGGLGAEGCDDGGGAQSQLLQQISLGQICQRGQSPCRVAHRLRLHRSQHYASACSASASLRPPRGQPLLPWRASSSGRRPGVASGLKPRGALGVCIVDTGHSSGGTLGRGAR